MSSFMKSSVSAPLSSASSRRSGTVSIAITRSAPSRKALRIANWPHRTTAPDAEEAFTAGDCEWHDDAVADLQLLVFCADLDNFAHRFMTVTAFHLGDNTVENMKIGGADGACCHLDAADGAGCHFDDASPGCSILGSATDSQRRSFL